MIVDRNAAPDIDSPSLTEQISARSKVAVCTSSYACCSSRKFPPHGPPNKIPMPPSPAPSPISSRSGRGRHNAGGAYSGMDAPGRRWRLYECFLAPDKAPSYKTAVWRGDREVEMRRGLCPLCGPWSLNGCHFRCRRHSGAARSIFPAGPTTQRKAL